MAIVKELTRNLSMALPPLIHLRESLGLPDRSCPSIIVNLESKVKCPCPPPSRERRYGEKCHTGLGERRGSLGSESACGISMLEYTGRERDAEPD